MSNELIKQMQELQEKANRYDNRKVKDQAIADKITRAVNLLMEVVKELQPTTGIRQPRAYNRSGGAYEEMIKDVYSLMQAGTEISTDWLKKTHASLDNAKANFIMQKLKKMANVESRKEGARLFLFARKDY